VGTITDKLAETLPAAAVLVPPGRVVAKALARHDRR
jgi:hypothetical protein